MLQDAQECEGTLTDDSDEEYKPSKTKKKRGGLKQQEQFTDVSSSDLSSSESECEEKTKPRTSKKRWRLEETDCLLSIFQNYLKHKDLRLRTSEIQSARDDNPCLQGRTIPQIRTKLNNIKLGK